MELGIIGIGRMGAGMVRRLRSGGHRVVAFDRSGEAVKSAEGEGAEGADSVEALARALATPRHVWVMVPAGDPTGQVVKQLAELLEQGDTVIDGGNSNYKDSMARASLLKERGMHFVDVGASGGIWGANAGFSLMVGGEKEPVERLRPIFETLAPAVDKGWGHVGGSGAGHFVKMVHNGIEYGLMQAYAEGFAIMEAKREMDLDLKQISGIWQDGSVIRSWLLDLIARALEDEQTLAEVAPFVADSGTGRWTVQEAIDLDVAAPVITHSLLQRIRSRVEASFSDKLLALMRHQFGGHAMRKADV